MLKLWLLFLYSFSNSFATGSLQYSIKTTWNGAQVLHSPVNLTFEAESTDNLVISIQAPYFGSPSPPEGSCTPGYPYDQLYNFEVVETFLLCAETTEYVELEFSPCGAHLVLLLHPTRNALVQYLPLNFTAEIDQSAGVWTGTASVPTSYLPNNVNRFNAFAIHTGSSAEQTGGLVWEDGNVYESLFPAQDGLQPDFHNLAVFEPFNPAELDLGEGERDLWDSVKNNVLFYQMDTSISGVRVDRPMKVWFETLEAEEHLKITVRQDKIPDTTPFTCDSLFETEDRHDNTLGVQVYLGSGNGMYLQLVLGYNPNFLETSKIDEMSNCVSASFLWGDANLLERRIGSNGKDFVYSETHLVQENKKVWEGTLLLSWNYLPPNLETIQIINNDNNYTNEVDELDEVLFRMDGRIPIHQLETSGLVYRSLLVDPEYNSVMSDIWEEVTMPEKVESV